MKKKHVHCIPICATPSNAAAHAKRDISLQHPMSCVLSGSVNIFAMLAVADTIPSSTNIGLRPRDDRRDMILWCCGRYETRMPTTMKLSDVSDTVGKVKGNTYTETEKLAMSGFAISSQRPRVEYSMVAVGSVMMDCEETRGALEL